MRLPSLDQAHLSGTVPGVDQGSAAEARWLLQWGHHPGSLDLFRGSIRFSSFYGVFCLLCLCKCNDIATLWMLTELQLLLSCFRPPLFLHVLRGITHGLFPDFPDSHAKSHGNPPAKCWMRRSQVL